MRSVETVDQWLSHHLLLTSPNFVNKRQDNKHVKPNKMFVNMYYTRWDFRFSQWLSMKMTVFWDVAPCTLVEIYWCFRGACCLHLIALMMEVASTSDTSVNFYQTTRCNISEDSHLHTCRCEKLKSQKLNKINKKY
jgi:hypothetical protein